MVNLKYGIVSEVKKGYARVKFEDLDGIVSDWLPVLVRRSKSQKESWQLEVNEHVVCMMDEHLETGVVLGAIPNDQDTPDPGEAAGKIRILFSDGTLFEYDINSHKMTVDVKGDLEAKTTGKCVVDAGTQLEARAGNKATVAAPDIELTGSVKISGSCEITGAVTILGATTTANISAGAVAAAGLTVKAGGKLTSEGGAPLDSDVDIITTGDVIAGGKSLKSHTHTAPSGGGPTSAPI